MNEDSYELDQYELATERYRQRIARESRVEQQADTNPVELPTVAASERPKALPRSPAA